MRSARVSRGKLTLGPFCSTAHLRGQAHGHRSIINAPCTNVAGGAGRAAEEPYIASMGIYVAKASAIRDLLMKHYPQARRSVPARLSASPRMHTGFVETLAIVDRCALSCRPDCCCGETTLLRGPDCRLKTLHEVVR